LQEARELAEHWRREAEAQRKAAASARAPETARHIKQLQDSNIAARAALLEKDAALAQVCDSVTECCVAAAAVLVLPPSVPTVQLQ
jgi:hypothetical protein